MHFNALALMTVATVSFVAGMAANAQEFNAVGSWSCSATLYDPGQQPYGYQAEINVQPNGGLFANGGVYNPNLMQSIVPIQAPGDWGVFPDANGILVRFRVHTDSHGILVFESYATSATATYLRGPLDSGGEVEVVCSRTG